MTDRAGRQRVTRAMAAQPRDVFLPAAVRDRAAEDRALPIGYAATNSQPSTVATMITLLDPQPGDRILDVGSGSGWTCAILGELAGPEGTVLGLDVVPELVARATAALVPRQLPWVRVEGATPGVLGRPEGAGWDRILVSADGNLLPPELTDQLAEGGRLVLPVAGRLTVVDRTAAGLVEHRVRGRWSFVPLQ